jgi:tyrosyl-tRNA synthetase
MSFIEELRWRGMLQDITPGTEERLLEKKCTGYIGFDPTAPSLTLGNYVQVMLLKLFQQHGHRPLVLMGGATGRIGDPSGKDQERQLKTVDELDANLARQVEQMRSMLDFDDKTNGAILVNNIDFYKGMGVLDFLRDVGKHLTVNYMLSKESVKKRLDTGISFTEFSYQLIQGYDFVELYRRHNCEVQMGGSDQWGNITAGTEMLRRLGEGPAFAMTTPLLTKADGKKFGKSEEGNIWMDPNLTSPYKFYQFWINTEDADVPKLFRYFSLRPKLEIEAVDKRINTEPNEVKRELAEELTVRIHSKIAFEAVRAVTEILFSKMAGPNQWDALDTEALEAISNEIPTLHVSSNLTKKSELTGEMLSETAGIFQSKGECRRAIQNNAVSINKVKIGDYEAELRPDDWKFGKYLMVENGKKNKYLIIADI